MAAAQASPDQSHDQGARTQQALDALSWRQSAHPSYLAHIYRVKASIQVHVFSHAHSIPCHREVLLP